MQYKRFNYIFIGIVVAVLLAVISINVFDRREHVSVSKRDKELGWVFAGSRVQEEVGYGPHTLRFNSLGIRGAEIQGPVQMLLLGNSVTLGQHVSEDKTFAALLGAVNAGQDGYDTYQLVRKLERDLAQLKPHSVGLVVVGIDIMSGKASHERIKQTVLNNDDLRPFPWLDFGKVISRVKAASMTEEDQHYLNSVSRRIDEDTWREWTAQILKLKELSGDDFFIVLSPPRSQVISYQNGLHQYWVNDSLKDFAIRNNIKFIDLLPELANANAEKIYIDHVHFNRQGHSLVAEIIKRELAAE